MYRAGVGETQDDVIVKLDEIITRQKADASNRKIALYIAAASAVFAAAKLGVIAIPHIRRLRKGK
jgi:hypothetical protein